MRRCFALAFAVALSLSIPFPASADMILGEGNTSCGTWTKIRRNNDVDAILQFGAWIRGFLTVMNEKYDGDVTGGVDNNGLLAWIDNYCLANPLDQLYKAVNSLSSELTYKFYQNHHH